MDFGRFQQLLKFGIIDAKCICLEEKYNSTKVFFIYLDIIKCFFLYRMKSLQYKDNKFYKLSQSEKKIKGKELLKENRIRDSWYKNNYQTKKFLAKYTSIKYDGSIRLQEKRNKAYKKMFSLGNNCWVHHNVIISREHLIDGKLIVGNNVLLGKNTFIDYTGNLTLKDGARITNGVIIETHAHSYHSDYRKNKNEIKASPLTIEEGAVIGCRAIIMSTCNYIGKYSRIGAGAVVTHDVPDYAIVVGIPAKVIKIIPHNLN